jgi:hypothetical protein
MIRQPLAQSFVLLELLTAEPPDPSPDIRMRYRSNPGAALAGTPGIDTGADQVFTMHSSRKDLSAQTHAASRPALPGASGPQIPSGPAIRRRLL